MVGRGPLILTALDAEAQAVAAVLAAHDLKAEAIGIRACRLHANLSDRGVSLVIMAGLAGALDPTLKIGDLVLDGPQEGSRWRRGGIYTAQGLVATPQEKADLFARTGALAVEMENAIVRRAAEAASLPFIGLRAISDTAGEGIDPAIPGLVHEFGRPKPMAVAKLLLARPGMMAELMRLKANSDVALVALAEGMKTLIELIEA